MKKIIIIIILTFFSIAVSQGKMILNNGEVIVANKEINLSDINSNNSFINFNSKFYSKSKVALVISSEDKILFRSGMLVSKYNSLSIKQKAKVDRKYSSVGFKNINNELINTLNTKERELYLNTFENYNHIDYKGCIFKALGACAIINLIAIISFMQTGFGF
tara:strand:+ start:172 stop:657 length:486 start_codon:yes stop_codon:yes gene_type:complete